LRRGWARRQSAAHRTDPLEEIAMDAYALKRVDDLASIDHGAVKLAGDELGVQSFGLQVLDLPAGFTDYPAHDHVHDGQEEVYVVLEGSADFEIAGECVPADAGTMLRVDPASRRTLVPGPSGVRLLAIGCAPGGTYERPEAFRLAGRS
jgi:mannose-6-phosphate isomerase-like protein (cupin superfamily)